MAEIRSRDLLGKSEAGIAVASAAFNYGTMIDLLYLAKGRPEFTAASLAALKTNTDWDCVRNAWIYLDGCEYDRPPFLGDYANNILFLEQFGGPVAIMNHFLGLSSAEIFAKIDNDCIVPPGWLEQSLAVMEQHPHLDLLGIEPPSSRTPAPWSKGGSIECPEASEFHRRVREKQGWDIGYAPCDSIGGIGLMRRSAFQNRRPMEPHAQNGVGGFTDWQLHFADVCKGWIVPPLQLFLLDRLPFEPWVSLSKKYIAEGIQRPWTNYPESASHLWEWWLKPND